MWRVNLGVSAPSRLGGLWDAAAPAATEDHTFGQAGIGTWQAGNPNWTFEFSFRSHSVASANRSLQVDGRDVVSMGSWDHDPADDEIKANASAVLLPLSVEPHFQGLGAAAPIHCGIR
jgi:hypothetical protein